MSFSVRVHAQLLLAVTSAISACNKQPAPADAAVSSPMPAATTTEPTAPSASVPPAESARPEQHDAGPGDAGTKPASRGLVCAQYSTPDHVCVTPRTPPPTGDMRGIHEERTFSEYDANGCYAASALIGTCTGVKTAAGPVRAGGKCCYDVCRVPVPCGRPIVVDGHLRLAKVKQRDDWSGPAIGLDVDSALRQHAADAWLYDARMEHASVASFARLSLELMAVGAPSALVEAAHRAALQEIDHARTCFAIAAELSHGGTIGPSELPMDGVRLRSDLREIALEAATQSCVGETVAALALARASESCASEGLRARLAAMAEDELSHAALGFRIVAWSIAQLGPRAGEEILERLRVSMHDAPISSADGGADAWRALGRLTREDLRAVERDACGIVAAAEKELRVALRPPTIQAVPFIDSSPGAGQR